MSHSLCIRSPIEGHLGCFQVLALNERGCCKCLCAGFGVDKHRQLIWVNTKERHYWNIWWDFCKKPPKYLPEWLSHFAFWTIIFECVILVTHVPWLSLLCPGETKLQMDHWQLAGSYFYAPLVQPSASQPSGEWSWTERRQNLLGFGFWLPDFIFLRD